METLDPQGGASLNPRGSVCTNLNQKELCVHLHKACALGTTSILAINLKLMLMMNDCFEKLLDILK